LWLLLCDMLLLLLFRKGHEKGLADECIVTRAC
jgi:hypothetical protein